MATVTLETKKIYLYLFNGSWSSSDTYDGYIAVTPSIIDNKYIKYTVDLNPRQSTSGGYSSINGDSFECIYGGDITSNGLDYGENSIQISYSKGDSISFETELTDNSLSQSYRWFLYDEEDLSNASGEEFSNLTGYLYWDTPNTQPTATISATNIAAGKTATVNWSYSDADGDTVRTSSLKRYYQASGSTTWTNTSLSVSTSATSYSDAIPSGYAGGKVYYKLGFYDGYGTTVYQNSSTYTVTSNTAPSAPSTITIPSDISSGNASTISWSAASDAESNLSGYVLQCQVDGGSWTQIYKGASRSYSYTVPVGTETLAFRVKAYDSEGAESEYKTSSTVNVPFDPSTLTFVEYIESSGTQYIDTLYTPTNNTRVLLDAQITQGETGEKQLFGLRESTSGPFLTFFLTTANKISSRWRETAIKTFSSSDTIYERHTFDRNQNTATYDGETLTWEDTEFTFSYTLPLLCRKTGTTIDEHIKAKVYSCQIYENDTLVRDFQPAINLNGEAGLYDAVNNKFYKNAGSGAFTVPRLYDSLPSSYILATYVETSGTQYIDTGFIPNSSSRLVMDVYPQYSGTAYEGLFGARPSTNTDAFGVWVRNDGVFLNYNDGTITTYTFSIDPAQRMLIDISPGETTINDTSITTTTTSFDTGNNLVLMAYNTGGTIDTRMANARMYSCQIYNSGSLVRDYLPCVEEATGKIGLFDLQDGVFYPFQGTYTVKAVVEGAINGYVNIGGVHKKILREYENINGVLRLGSDWQTNIDGVLKSSAFEQEYTYDLGNPTYVWEKYTVGTEEGAPYTKTSGTSNAYIYYADTIYYASSYSFSSTTGKYTLISPSSMTGQDFKTNYNTYSDYYFISGSSSGTVMYQSSGFVKGYVTDSNNTTIGAIDISATRYYRTGTDIEVCGTYMYDVTSTNSSTYPSNGKHSDGYWYISDGTYIESSTYTWKKYNTKETEGAPYTQTKSSSQTISTSMAYYWVANSFTFNTSTGIYTLTSPSLKARSNIKTSSYKYYQAGSSTSSGTYSAKNYMYQTTKSTAPSYNYDTMGYTTTGYKYTATPSITYSAGDYVSEVTSTSASAYPENGKHTDGYWYILKQIQ